MAVNNIQFSRIPNTSIGDTTWVATSCTNFNPTGYITQITINQNGTLSSGAYIYIVRCSDNLILQKSPLLANNSGYFYWSINMPLLITENVNIHIRVTTGAIREYAIDGYTVQASTLSVDLSEGAILSGGSGGAAGAVIPTLVSYYSRMPKTSVYSMNIGDIIPCNYTATSNSFGTFSQLGTSVATEIPVASSATPSGTFYFIMIGYDSKGRKKLVADRSIQSSIAWDTLNTAGIASGSGLPLTIDGNTGYTMRLLSGGTSATDTDNEWDKIIVGSTLNGIITAGDNNVWNWTVFSPSSTTYPGYPDSRVIRGASYITAYNGYSTDTVNANMTFRPVLLVDSLPITITINSVNPTHVYKTDSNISVSQVVTIFGNIAVQVLINGNVATDYGSYSKTATYNLNIPLASLTVGSNTITINAKNTSGNSGSVSVPIIKEAPQRTSVARTFLSYDGGYVETGITTNSNLATLNAPFTGTTINLGSNEFSVDIPKYADTVGVK